VAAAVVSVSAVIAIWGPLAGLVLVSALVGLVVALYCAFRLPWFVFVLLVTKPLIDLTWRWRFFTVAGQGVNVQSLVGVLVIAVTGLSVLFWKKRMVFDLPVILLLGFACISVLLTPSSAGINELVRLFAGLSLFFTAGIALDSEKSFNRFATCFVLVVSIPCILTILQRFGLIPFDYWDWIGGIKTGRPTGTYQHPLGLIYYLIYAVPLALYLTSRPQQTLRRRLFLWGIVGLCLVALFFTYHRTALVTIGLQIWLWMVLNKKFGRAVLMVTVGAVAAFWLRDWIQTLYANLVDILQGEIPLFSQHFLRGRGTVWYLFLHSLIDSHPFYWLFGRGGSLAEGFVPLWGFKSSNEPHNDFLRILHAYGFLGLGLYFTILVSGFRRSLRLWRAHDGFVRQVGTLGLVALVGVILLSFTTEPLRYPAGAWYLFAFGSVVASVCRRLSARS
jgi:O-antigen ligase